MEIYLKSVQEYLMCFEGDTLNQLYSILFPHNYCHNFSKEYNNNSTMLVKNITNIVINITYPTQCL